MSDYRVAAGPLYSPARLARARRYDRLEDALAVMGTGVVVADRTRLVAFHETHLDTVTRLA